MKMTIKTTKMIEFEDEGGYVHSIEFSEEIVEVWKMIRAAWCMYGEQKKVIHIKMVRSILDIGLHDAAYLVKDAYNCETRY